MEVLYPRCCGLDIHKQKVVACLIAPGPGGAPREEVRTFGAMTADLLALSDWLVGAGCTHVAMESTGSYWKPVWNLLENAFELLLANPQHMKALPGRKTDVKDCQWIAQLLRHGLLTPSFVPGRAQRELRELVRYRTSPVRERAAEVNRVQKLLEGANIKLASVASDVMGVSGRAMLAELVAGNPDPAAMADLAKGPLRRKLGELERALAGSFGQHQAFLVARQLAHIDYLDGLVAELSAKVAEEMRPFEAELELLDTIPGVGRRVAETIVAEVGADARNFPSAGHLASWAGLTPGHNESAGKRGREPTRKGNKALRGALVEAGHAAGRTKTFLGARYWRLAHRRGKAHAAVAVGHSILVIAYHVLRDRAPYEDLGYRYFDERDREATQRRLIRRLRDLGCEVTVTPKPEAA
jgi:transposase